MARATSLPGDLSYENRSGKANLIAKIVDTSGTPLPNFTTSGFASADVTDTFLKSL